MKLVKCVCGGDAYTGYADIYSTIRVVRCDTCESATPLFSKLSTAIRVWNLMQKAAKKEAK